MTFLKLITEPMGAFQQGKKTLWHCLTCGQNFWKPKNEPGDVRDGISNRVRCKCGNGEVTNAPA